MYMKYYKHYFTWQQLCRRLARYFPGLVMHHVGTLLNTQKKATFCGVLEALCVLLTTISGVMR
jgi:hypothetical protein